MSIYATLWRLKFPRYGDDHSWYEWVTVLAQGVPAHVGKPAPGTESEDENPCSAFLPPAGTHQADDGEQTMRAVIFITDGTPEGMIRSPQEYVRSLLVLSGQECASISFRELHELICDASGATVHDSWPKCAHQAVEVGSSSKMAASRPPSQVVNEARPRRRLRGRPDDETTRR
jgi:hypothetical protein